MSSNEIVLLDEKFREDEAERVDEVMSKALDPERNLNFPKDIDKGTWHFTIKWIEDE